MLNSLRPCWLWRCSSWSHGFEQSAEFAIRRNHCRGILFKSSAHDVEAAKEGIKFLRLGRIECRRINGSRFGIGFAFDLERIFGGSRTDRGNVAFFLAADIRGFATAFGTESRRDLMPLTRHAFDDFLGDCGIVFAALKAFVE